jgi:pimeloyl-ACP methyl ester carboxylesterase
MSDPTVTFIHGAFADASSWRGLHAALAGDGLDVRAPANLLRGVTAGYAAYAHYVLAAIDGPVVLVGHSYGGAVITAAGLSANVVGLV